MTVVVGGFVCSRDLLGRYNVITKMLAEEDVFPPLFVEPACVNITQLELRTSSETKDSGVAPAIRSGNGLQWYRYRVVTARQCECFMRPGRPPSPSSLGFCNFW